VVVGARQSLVADRGQPPDASYLREYDFVLNPFGAAQQAAISELQQRASDRFGRIEKDRRRGQCLG